MVRTHPHDDRTLAYALVLRFGLVIVFCAIQICLGTINNIDEGVEWLSYTYLYVRMRLNPLAYGIPHHTKEVG